MNRAEFVELHPKLFHMASDGAWPSIQRLGLLSATAILDLAGVDGERRVGFEQQRRAESVIFSIDGIDFVLRDQKPLSEGKLEQCLSDMTVGEWLRLLNRKVFLWPTRQRCAELLNARAYRGFQHTIVEIDTAALLERHDVLLSPINSEQRCSALRREAAPHSPRSKISRSIGIRSGGRSTRLPRCPSTMPSPM